MNFSIGGLIVLLSCQFLGPHRVNGHERLHPAQLRQRFFLGLTS
jgi:hypothetical protein